MATRLCDEAEVVTDGCWRLIEPPPPLSFSPLCTLRPPVAFCSLSAGISQEERDECVRVAYRFICFPFPLFPYFSSLETGSLESNVYLYDFSFLSVTNLTASGTRIFEIYTRMKM